MGTHYARAIKPEFANEFDCILEVTNQVRRVIAGIVHEDPNSDEFINEVKIQMQPSPDGGLAIIGWCAKDPVPGIPDERFNREIEAITQLLTPEEEMIRREQLIVDQIAVPETSPFKR